MWNKRCGNNCHGVKNAMGIKRLCNKAKWKKRIVFFFQVLQIFHYQVCLY